MFFNQHKKKWRFRVSFEWKLNLWCEEPSLASIPLQTWWNETQLCCCRRVLRLDVFTLDFTWTCVSESLCVSVCVCPPVLSENNKAYFYCFVLTYFLFFPPFFCFATTERFPKATNRFQRRTMCKRFNLVASDFHSLMLYSVRSFQHWGSLCLHIYNNICSLNKDNNTTRR